MRTRTFASGLFLFAIVVAGCSGSGSTPVPAGAASPAPRTISGQITYAGSSLGNHKILVVVGRVGEQGAPAYSTVIAGPGLYTLSNLADGTYNVLAFIDLGDDMGAPKADEPQGTYDVAGDGISDPVVILDGKPATGVDITLRDK